MRRRHGVAVALGLTVAAIVPLTATADVTEPYEEERVVWDGRYACAESSSESGGVRLQTSACGYVESYDDAQYAAIDIARSECTRNGGFETCTTTSGYASVDPSTITIDLDAGTGSITAVIDECAVDLELVATGGDSLGFGSYGLAPSARTRDLAIRTHRGWEFEDGYATADATGSVCDWFSGDWDEGEMGRFRETEREAGIRLRPEDLPVAGGVFTRGERPSGNSASQRACGFWDQYGAEADTYIEVCGNGYDVDDDGTYEMVEVSAGRLVCDINDCDFEGYSGSGYLSVDLDHGLALIGGTLNQCTVDVELLGDQDSRGQGSFDYQYDSIEPGAEPGEVTLGRSERFSYDGMFAEPLPGAVACDWAEVADADWTSGFMELIERDGRAHYIAVDPAGL